MAPPDLSIDGVKVLPAGEVLQRQGAGGKATRSRVEPYHHPVHSVGDLRQMMCLHHAGGRGRHLRLRRHLQEPRLVLANGEGYALRHTASCRLRDPGAEASGPLEMAARIVVESHQHLLQHSQRPAPIAHKVKLLEEHVNESVDASLCEPEGPLELCVVEHDDVVCPPVEYLWLPHQLEINHLLKLLHLLFSPPMIEIKDISDTVHDLSVNNINRKRGTSTGLT